MMHLLRKYDVVPFCRNDAMFAPMCPQAHIIRVANIIRRSRHHLPEANIIQKTHFVLVDKSAFFVGRGRR